MRFALAICLFAFAAPALADDTIDVPCGPLADLPDRAAFHFVTRDEWLALRVVFFMAPQTPANFPPGDRAILRDNPDGSSNVMFVDGDEACVQLRLSAEVGPMLKMVRDKTITHPPGKM